MNNEQLPPPTLGGAERLSHKAYKSYKFHNPYKTYKPPSPPWGIEGAPSGGLRVLLGEVFKNDALWNICHKKATTSL